MNRMGPLKIKIHDKLITVGHTHAHKQLTNRREKGREKIEEEMIKKRERKRTQRGSEKIEHKKDEKGTKKK